MINIPRRGELWWAEMPDIGRRPVLVLSRDPAIPRLRRALVAPCTTIVRGLPSEVVLDTRFKLAAEQRGQNAASLSGFVQSTVRPTPPSSHP